MVTYLPKAVVGTVTVGGAGAIQYYKSQGHQQSRDPGFRLHCKVVSLLSVASLSVSRLLGCAQASPSQS